VKPIRLKTDASSKAITRIISQPIVWPVPAGERPEYHPVAFFSKKMNPAEENYGTPNQELIAIIKSFIY
jgi:hypothetical protein